MKCESDMPSALWALVYSGAIDQALYYKMLLELAATWCERENIEGAVDLVRKVPWEYWNKDYIPQTKEDPFFLKQTSKLSTALIDAGVIDLQYLGNSLGQKYAFQTIQ